jgi:hypothetical protein
MQRPAVRVLSSLLITVALPAALPVGATASVARKPAKPTAVLFGQRTVNPTRDRRNAGRAEAFSFKATTTGKTASITVYVDSHSTARVLLAGIYSNDRGRPGRRLTTGSLSKPKRKAWDAIKIRAITVIRGRTYWIAMVSRRGAIVYRVRRRKSCTSFTSARGGMRSLPESWRGGTRQHNCTVSAHVNGYRSASPTKPTVPTPTPTPPVTTPPATPPSLPSGVTLQAIDGGPSFFGAWSDGFPTSPSFFPIGVFDQSLGYNSSSGTYSQSEITAYKNEGINTFINLYNGYNQKFLSAIHSLGMYALTGPTAPSYANGTIDGYVWFDEADGTNDCGSVPSSSILGESVSCSPTSSGATPSSVIAQVNADLQGAHGAGDKTRPDYCQYTKPVAELSGLSTAQAAAYVNAGCDIVSYDSYIINDSYASNHDLWRQYDDVENVRRLAADKLPVWPFIEAGEVFNSDQWSGITATPAMSVAEAWNAIIAGARGIQWFDHDFGGSDGGYATSSDDLIDTNSVFTSLQSTVKAFDAEVTGLAPVLNSSFANGYVTNNGSMNVMAKYDAATNDFYVFAAPRSASAQTITFKVTGGYSGPVTVYDEGRTVTAADGQFTDTFSGQTAVHVYVIPNS